MRLVNAGLGRCLGRLSVPQAGVGVIYRGAAN
jgi:hypothetical protein